MQRSSNTPRNSTKAQTMQPARRRLLKAGGVTLATLSAPALVMGQTSPKIRVGFWPVASGIPFFAAIEKGYFKEAGLDVEPLKLASPQQVAD